MLQLFFAQPNLRHMKVIVKVLGYTLEGGQEGSFTSLNMFYFCTVPEAHNKDIKPLYATL